MTVAVRRPTTVCFARLVRDGFTVADDQPVWHLGGGAWAAFGAALVSDDVWLASGVGPDAAPEIDALARMGIASNALLTTSSPTPATYIRYIGGERKEDPIGGFPQHEQMELDLDQVDLPVGCGVYVLRPANLDFWSRALARASDLAARVCWELHASTCRREYLNTVVHIARNVEVVSLNLAEARALAGSAEPDRILAIFDELATPHILLRLGPAGSIVWSGSGVVHVLPPVTGVAVDPTGAGNAYSGAYLAALLAGDDEPATSAAAAAATAIEQLGMPADLAVARRRFGVHRAAAVATTISHADIAKQLGDVRLEQEGRLIS